MVRNLRAREVNNVTKDVPEPAPAPEPAAEPPAAPEPEPPKPEPATTAEAKPEEKAQAEEVLVGHTQMDLVALGQRADKEQRAAEEEKLPCFSRCCVRCRHCCQACCRSIASCVRRRLDAWEQWLADREQAALRYSFEKELRRLAPDLPAPGALELWGPSVRTMEKCQALTFTEKEVQLAFTEAQLKRVSSLLKAKAAAPRQILQRLLGQLTVVVLVSIVVFCVLATIALAPSRSLRFNSGIILEGSSPVAGASSVKTQPLWDFPNLSFDQLRQVEDVLFEEKQRAHILKIAATSKLPDGSVILRSADSTLRVTAEGDAYWSQGSAEVILKDMAALRSLEGPATVGGLFSAARYQ